ncbi:MAG: hypothetical protein K1V96_04155 [Lachnospiraceae bacterium]
MKMAMREGQILIKDIDDMQFTIIKSWGKMKWNKKEQMLYAPIEIELLNRLSGIVRLPEPIEAERQRLNMIAQAVDAERMNPDPKPLYKYPVKFPLYKHQVRAANMCLLTFELIEPSIKKGS